MIIIRVGNTHSQVEGLNEINIIDALSRELSYDLESARHTMRFKRGMWDGKVRLLDRNLQFPCGLTERARRLISSFGLEVSVIDKRDYASPIPGMRWSGPQPYDYQKKVLDIAINSKGGMVKVCTGGGKSIIIGQLVYEFNLPTMVYVVSLDLLDQMKETLEACLGVSVGMVGGGTFDIQKITVCSVWTAGQLFSKKKQTTSEDIVQDKWSPSYDQKKELRKAIENTKVMILDEAQFAAAESIQSILKNSKSAGYRYGFSATPWRMDGDDMLLEATFGDEICNITATELIRKDYLVTPRIIFRDIPHYSTELPRSWNPVRSTYIVNNKVRNNMLIDDTVKLLEMGRKPLLMFRIIKHGEKLEELLPSDVRYKLVTGKMNKDDRRQVREDFKDGKLDLILASTVYDQGIDLPNLDALVLAGGGKSTAKALQRVGRVIRSNKDYGKEDAIVVETFDQAHYLTSHSMSRYNIYNSEPAFVVKSGGNMSGYLDRRGLI